MIAGVTNFMEEKSPGSRQPQPTTTLAIYFRDAV